MALPPLEVGTKALCLKQPQVQVCASSSKSCFVSYRIIGWICILVCVCYVCVKFRAWLAHPCWLLSCCTALHWGTIDWLPEVLLNAFCLQVCKNGWFASARAGVSLAGQLLRKRPTTKLVRYPTARQARLCNTAGNSTHTVLAAGSPRIAGWRVHSSWAVCRADSAHSSALLHSSMPCV